jgi:hypothetical protein
MLVPCHLADAAGSVSAQALLASCMLSSLACVRSLYCLHAGGRVSLHACSARVLQDFTSHSTWTAVVLCICVPIQLHCGVVATVAEVSMRCMI